MRRLFSSIFIATAISVSIAGVAQAMTPVYVEASKHIFYGNGLASISTQSGSDHVVCMYASIRSIKPQSFRLGIDKNDSSYHAMARAQYIPADGKAHYFSRCFSTETSGSSSITKYGVQSGWYTPIVANDTQVSGYYITYRFEKP